MLGGTNDFSCWSLPPAAALGLRPRRVGQLAAPFPGDFGEFGAAFPRHFGEFGAAFAGDFGESVAAFAGDFGEFGAAFAGDFGEFGAAFAGDSGAFAGDSGEFVAAFPRDVCQFAAPLGADLSPRPSLSASALSASALLDAAPTGSAAVTVSDTLRAACRPRQPRDGLPSVSTAAMISPPMRLTSARKARRSSALRCGSASFQNICPPRLPGITLSARVADANRGILPVANSSPPPIWTAPLMRATVSALNGTFGPTGSGSLLRPSRVGRAAAAAGLGLRRASTPRPMKTADNMGRAIRRTNMADGSPARRHKPG
jgi:hypothetical protein